MKKLLPLLALTLLAVVPALAEPTIFLEVTPSPAKPGDDITVAVKVNDEVKGVAGAAITVDWATTTPAGAPALAYATPDDPTQSVVNGDLLPTALLAVNAQPTSAIIGLVATAGANGPKTAATLKLKAPTNLTATTTYELKLSAELNDENANPVAVKAVGASLRVEVAAAPPPAAGKVLVSADKTKVKPGDTVVITVAVNDAVKGVAGGLVTLAFGDQAKVADEAAVKSSASAGLLAGALVEVNTQVAGQIAIGIVGTTGKNGPGNLVQVPLAIAATATGKVDVKTTVELNDENANPIAVTVEPETLSIEIEAAAPPPPAVGAKALVSVDKTKVKPEETVTVTVAVNEAVKKLAGGLITITFGPNARVADEAAVKNSVNAGLLTGALAEVNTQVAGEVRIGLVSTAGKDGPGNIVQVPLAIAKEATGKVDITVTAELNDVDANPIAVTVEPATVSVEIEAVAPPPPPPPPAAGKVEVTVDKAQAAPGDTVVVTVAVDANVKKVAGGLIKVTFGPQATVVSEEAVKDAVKAGILADALAEVNLQVAGEATIGLVSTTGKDGPGVLVKVPLALKADAKGKIDINVTAELNDVDANPIQVSGVPATVSVEVAVAPPPPPPPGVPKPKSGDFNADGKVDVADVKAAIKFLFRPERTDIPQAAAAKAALDLDGDGKVSLAEVRTLLRVAAGLEKLPG